MHLSSLVIAAAFAASAAAQMSLMEILAANNKTLGTLTALLQNQPELATNLLNARNITILAPSNDAFSRFLSTPGGQATSNDPGKLTALLQYHVLVGAHPSSALNMSIYPHSILTNSTYTNVTNGQVVQLSKMGNKVMAMSGLKEMSMSTTMDVMFTGGVVHVIDKVLTVPMMPSMSAVDSGLTGLAGALTSTGLVPTIDSARDVTIFAPSNAAFQNIGSALPALQADPTMFRNILAYHVVSGTVGYAGMLGNMSLMTAQGGMVNIEVVDKKVFVNSAQVIISDVIVANGVVHVIDNVLNPANATATPIPTATVQPVAFSGVSSASVIPFTSGITPTTTAPSASTKTAAAGRVEGAMGLAALFGAVAVGGVL
ncbi:hypothetical protein ONS95_007115 [Cadophora gregata]|uniref:uncharacterized protein n=1 Tax=Cadophora gregata TaxID=51156 RepID=UPI0026DC2938|nr:uncharacterized protein ONS95_007115 [Cadophora gregata]KAK0100663.1 hypothetical protein ONS95_007115 [Cadophora gregata]KAK0117339.1 hypothetical protein ONS96_013172 [Cadophora gregata f. sp. sojae]